MPWFIQLVVGTAVFLSIVLLLDHLRRRGLPRLSLRILLGSGIPDELARRLAKTVSEGEFDRSQFRKGTYRTLFPTQVACPHCKGGSKSRNVWEIAKVERLLGNLDKLAREIKRKRLCHGCLGQLSETAKVRGKLKKLGEEDQNPPSSIRPLIRGYVLLLIGVVLVFVTLCVSLPALLLILLRIVPILAQVLFRY